jgi:hypothetical protein
MGRSLFEKITVHVSWYDWRSFLLMKTTVANRSTSLADACQHTQAYSVTCICTDRPKTVEIDVDDGEMPFICGLEVV